MARPCGGSRDGAAGPARGGSARAHKPCGLESGRGHDQASEQQAAKPLLDPLTLRGRVVTADALHTQTETARYLVEEEKRRTTCSRSRTTNQSWPTSQASTGRPFPLNHTTTHKAHGRVETRRIWVSDTLNGYVTFPHAAQVACVEREIFHVRNHKTTLERVYLITSQPRAEAGPTSSWRRTGAIGLSRTACIMCVHGL